MVALGAWGVVLVGACRSARAFVLTQSRARIRITADELRCASEDP